MSLLKKDNIDVNEVCDPINENSNRIIHQNYNSFIQFNNNLSLKLAAEKSKNTITKFVTA